MSEVVNYKCLSCNGPLRFDAASGQLTCDYCGSTFSVQQIEEALAAKQEQADAKAEKETAREQAAQAEAQAWEAEAQGEGEGQAAQGEQSQTQQEAPQQAHAAADPIQEFLNRAPWTDAAQDDVHSYTCSACAAQLLVDSTTAITECPYCGNQSVIPNQVTGAMKPDYIIPFKVTKDQAMDALKSHYQGKSLLPNAFSEQNHLEHIQGVYVPFWLYTYKANGHATYRAERIRVWTDGRGDTMQETSSYDCTRVGSMEFKNIPADGSSKMPDAHMDAIEPFDYSELQPFSVAYLPGYAAERYDVDAEACKSRATGRMETSVEEALANTVEGYDNVSTESKQVDATLESVSYALMPVWMLHTRWNNEDYLFAMNGQTGKFIGDLPIDSGKVVKWFAGVAIPVFAVVFGALTVLM